MYNYFHHFVSESCHVILYLCIAGFIPNIVVSPSWTFTMDNDGLWDRLASKGHRTKGVISAAGIGNNVKKKPKMLLF